MSLVRVFSTALDVDAIGRDADGLAACPNFWIPRERLQVGDVHTVVEQEVCRLLHGVLRHSLPPAWSGAEYWVQARSVLARPTRKPRGVRFGIGSDAPAAGVQTYEAGRGLAFHFDKDEQRYRDQRVMAHPLLSTVLYLAGDAGAARLGAQALCPPLARQ